jgi:ribosomal protein L40E
VHPDFGFELIEGLHSALPLSKRRLFRKDLCRACGVPIEAKSVASSTGFTCTVHTKHAEPFEATLSGRTVKCGRCGLEQLTYDRNFFANLPEAVMSAFRAIRLA